MNKRLIAGAVVFLLFTAAAGYKLFSAKEDGITATGTIEVTRVDIMPKVSGYLAGLSINAGDYVKAGDTVARISRPDLEAQVLRDEAALVKAQVQLSDLEKGSRRQELEEAAASLASARSVFAKAKADLERYTSLYNSGAISAQQLDAARSAYDVAYNSLLAAQSRQSLLEEGYRPDVIEAQRLEVTRAQAILDASKAMLADTIVTSPLTGLVLSKNFENGEYVNPGSPIATIADLNDCWIKIYVSSAQLGLIKVGQPAAVKIDAYPDRTFTGHIKEIGQNAEFTPRQSITQRERANMVFAVKVKIDNAEGLLKPGMPADVILK
ncbi:HlyD family secretion protein [Sporolituus thermophilus]|uniref:HlyD family secretion protein n=1 Tax=Sporolituus thermophilus DSM 23256 TaxID=1123285 RepID=A0A1G7NHL5_9FIRM|nr:efflux RND transporter periplasmic adaptor subunit [Sporolituus thermophilus]SDF73523.1 HlyD family secretion protein [Sporolituus thermophilus DSM 23256]